MLGGFGSHNSSRGDWHATGRTACLRRRAQHRRCWQKVPVSPARGSAYHAGQLNMSPSGAQALYRDNREAGEIPARTRHCDVGQAPTESGTCQTVLDAAFVVRGLIATTAPIGMTSQDSRQATRRPPQLSARGLFVCLTGPRLLKGGGPGTGAQSKSQSTAMDVKYNIWRNT